MLFLINPSKKRLFTDIWQLASDIYIKVKEHRFPMLFYFMLKGGVLTPDY